LRSAYIQVNKTREQLEAARTTKLWQKEKLRVEMEKFQVGKSNALPIAQAQRDLLNSEISEIEVLVNYLKNLTELHYLEGSLLSRYGISISSE